MLRCSIQKIKTSDGKVKCRLSIFRVVSQVHIPCFGIDILESELDLDSVLLIGIPVDTDVKDYSEGTTLLSNGYVHGVGDADSLEGLIREFNDAVGYIRKVEDLSKDDARSKEVINKATNIITKELDCKIECIDYANLVIEVECYADVSEELIRTLKEKTGYCFTPVIRNVSLSDGYMSVSFVIA